MLTKDHPLKPEIKSLIESASTDDDLVDAIFNLLSERGARLTPGDAAPRRRFADIQDKFLDHVASLGGIIPRQAIRDWMTEQGYVAMAAFLRRLMADDLLVKLRPGLYALPDYEPPKLGHTATGGSK